MVLKASDFDQSKYLGWKELGDVGFRKRYKIKTITVEEVQQDNGVKEKKVCVWFHNLDKGLLLNKTNLRTLAGKFGDDMDGWREKVVGLMVIMTEFRGKAQPGVRTYIPTPKSDGYKAPSPPPPQPVQQAAPLSAAATPPHKEEPPLEAYDDDNFDDDQELNDDLDDVG
jgi:hypothetical protein